MKFLKNAPRFIFFTGKGGVGKTSIACATAIHLAANDKNVLLVSTDPASNIGQVFGIGIGNNITAIPSVKNLSALEINPQSAAQQYREKMVGAIRGVLPDAVVHGIEEQLSGACTTEIAAFDEFTLLLTDHPMTAGFDHVIFDTAPTGHTIRLLQLPGAWSSFLEAGQGDASCLGPLAGLEKQRDQYKAAVDALADDARTRLVLVARAQASALREVARTHNELSALGLKQHHLVINGIMPVNEGTRDALAASVIRREKSAITSMPDELKSLPCDEIPLKSFNLVGLDALREFFHAKEVPAETPLLHGKVAIPPVSDLVDDIAKSGHGLVMVMGKGGVGKTTLAAAIAVALANKGFPVHLTTSDPAAHLSETLAETLEHLTVSRIDPNTETDKYRQRVMATKGAALDEQGRALLMEDLRSPCTEEIAVFQAFSRIIREAGKQFVVMDTAPTGHTLLLLDATGAYHREVARQMSDTVHFTTPMMQLQNPEKTKVVIVTLAETTPVLEASELQEDLRRAGIEPWAWIINNSVAATDTASPLLLQRAQNEIPQITKVANQLARRYAVVPLLTDEPVGAEKLLRISR